jgi:hypothetical protein
MKNEQVSIPFWIYLLIGIVMIVVSWIVDMQVEENQMMLFIFVGIIFILIGAGKGLYHKMVVEHGQRSKPKHHKPAHAHHPARQPHQHSPVTRPVHHRPQQVHQAGVSHVKHHTTHKHAQPPASHKPAHHHMPPVTCPKCHAKLHPKFTYCPGCGFKVK